MGLVAKDTGGDGDFTPVPQGTHLAICNMVVDLGHQETAYMGETKIKHQCFIRWELPHERIEFKDAEGQDKNLPMSIGKIYTVSLSEKANLRKDLEAWRGKSFTPQELEGFDLFNLLGKGCQVTVTHREKDQKTYANVTSLAGWPKGTPQPSATENELLRYSEDTPNDFEQLPEWLKTKILAAKPPDHMVNQDGDPGPQAAPEEELEDEIPF